MSVGPISGSPNARPIVRWRRTWSSVARRLGRFAPAALVVVLAASASAASLGTVVDGRVVWQDTHRAYRPGLETLSTVTPPGAVEWSTPTEAGWVRILYGPGTGSIPADGRWAREIRLSTRRPFTVNGQTYRVPARYAGQSILLLPIDGGIVWAVEDSRRLQAPPFIDTGSRIELNPAAVRGETPVFFTPYTGRGGSLATGARIIAEVPHRWAALNGPVAASAWTGWLPGRVVRWPTVVSVVAHTVMGHRDLIERTRLADWPTLFLTRVDSLQPKLQPCVASVAALVRTAGGFVLSVRLADPNDGFNAGMTEADYYWSERGGTWTPLTQLYQVQTLVSFVDAGSRAVYWQEVLPALPDGSLHLVQMRFDPVRGDIRPVWLGQFIDGPTFVDGATWVAGIPTDRPGTLRWIAYTPSSSRKAVDPRFAPSGGGGRVPAARGTQ
jgi:hypothetical protein